MEIDEARITFAGFQIRELELEKANKADKGGAFYTEPIIYTYTDEKARSIFEDALKNGFTVLGIGLDEEEYELEGISNSPLFYFTVRFSSWSIEVEWDDFCKAAWYELRRELRKEITLSTPNGDMITQARIICHDEDVYVLGKKLESPSVFVGITYGGTDLCGYGNDYLWVDAFADLQKKIAGKG